MSERAKTQSVSGLVLLIGIGIGLAAQSIDTIPAARSETAPERWSRWLAARWAL